MRAPGEILLVSTYELGHVPHGVALARAFLERAGFSPASLDLSIERWDPARIGLARLVLVSVPMHTALRLGLAFAERLRAERPDALLGFHGLYAPLNADLLVRRGAIAVLGGECEEDLAALAAAAERGEPLSRFVRRGPAPGRQPRLSYPVPVRDGLPPLERYARLVAADGTERVAGYTEATRGCKHLCRHCPVVPVYRGRFIAIPEATVVEDVARQVRDGARHVTFGDPDFLNGPSHALRVAHAIHARFPALTFDFTAKVEHIVARPGDVAALVREGAVFVTSAVESLSDAVLANLRKDHSREDALRAFDICADAGLALRPSLVPFTPWSTLEDLLDLLETFEARGWLPQLDPVQLSIRLLLPPGSLLVEMGGLAAPALADGCDTQLRLGPLDEEALTWRWIHPDPRMDALQREVAAAAADGERRREPAEETHARILALAALAAGRAMGPVVPTPHSGRRAPRLTEHWFC